MRTGKDLDRVKKKRKKIRVMEFLREKEACEAALEFFAPISTARAAYAVANAHDIEWLVYHLLPYSPPLRTIWRFYSSIRFSPSPPPIKDYITFDLLVEAWNKMEESHEEE